ncbi:MAG: lamin tail domain-containing protein [Sandaracinaceae bacterium]|nr:lamin tail domain-containing protein [Sandaracinaceae bacterium]
MAYVRSAALALAAVGAVAGCSCGAPPQSLDGVVFNEVRARSGDFVELYNGGSGAVDLSGFRLADGQATDTPRLDRAVTFPAGTSLPAGGYLVVIANQAAPAVGPTTDCGMGGPPSCFHAGWGIGGGGDTIFLVAPDGRQLRLVYPADAVPDGQSYGRLPNGAGDFAPNRPTPGASNEPPADTDGGVPDSGLPTCVPEPGVIEPIWMAGGTGPRDGVGFFGAPDAIFIDGDVLLAGDEDPTYDELHVYDIASDDPAVRADMLAPIADFGASPGPAGTGPMEFAGISGFARDSTGDVYVVEQRNLRVQVIRAVGGGHTAPYYEHVRFFGSGSATPDAPADGELVRPQAARFDSLDRLYLTDDAKNNAPTARRDVQIFDRDGNFLAKLGDESYGTPETGNLVEPENFVIDEARDRIYVCDETPNQINVYRYTDGAFVTRFGSFVGVPNGIDVDQYGFLYSVDEGFGVRVFDPSTLTEIFSFGSITTADDLTPGTFFSPDTLVIDIDSDLLVVADQGHDRVQGFRLSEIQARACLRALVTAAPARALAGQPTELRADLVRRDGRLDWTTWAQEARLSAARADGTAVAITPSTMSLMNGRGAVELTLADEGEIDVTVEIGGLRATRRVTVSSALPERAFTGALSGADLSWGPSDGVIRLSGTTTVPSGSTLSIAAGTLIRLDGGARLDIQGSVQASGTFEEPIHVTASDPAMPFDQIRHGAGNSTWSWTFVSHGGAGAWEPIEYRHCCRPMLYARGGEITLDHVVFADTPGAKAVQIESADAIIIGSLFARLGFGTEYAADAPFSQVIEDCVYDELRGADDNDGIYLWETGAMRIARTFIHGIDDDGIDTMAASPVIEDLVVHGVRDKCLSITSGDPVVTNALLTRCRIGVKEDVAPRALVTRPRFSRVTITDLVDSVGDPDPGSYAGVAFINTYDGGTPLADLRVVFEQSILWTVPMPVPIVTDFDPTWITFNGSDVTTSAVPFAGTGNVSVDPRFFAPARLDYRLRPYSTVFGLGFQGF